VLRPSKKEWVPKITQSSFFSLQHTHEESFLLPNNSYLSFSSSFSGAPFTVMNYETKEEEAAKEAQSCRSWN